MTRFCPVLSLLILFAVFSAFAEPPTTQSSENLHPKRPMLGAGPGGPGPAPTPAELEEAREYMQENFPRRYEVLTQLPPDAPFRRRLEGMMVERWRKAQRMKVEQPELYERIVAEQKLMDDAFGLAREIASGKEIAESQLREKVAALVERSLAERRERIARIEKQLEEQKQLLQKDESNRQELIDQRVEDIKREGKMAAERISRREERKERMEERREGEKP